MPIENELEFLQKLVEEIEEKYPDFTPGTPYFIVNKLKERIEILTNEEEG